jgi:peptidoglycan hydrolase-like protein with peptidoglycan-binding domain
VPRSCSTSSANWQRDFEQANGLRVAGEANETLLAELRGAKLRSEITGSIPKTPDAGRNRVVTVQRTLASYGYGPLRTNGQRDAETRAAIERFERNRDLPVTGEVTDRLMRDLAVFTGAPLE